MAALQLGERASGECLAGVEKTGGITLVTSYLLISNRIVSLPVSIRCCNSRCLVSNSNIRKFVCFCFCLGANNWCLPLLVLPLLCLYLSFITSFLPASILSQVLLLTPFLSDWKYCRELPTLLDPDRLHWSMYCSKLCTACSLYSQQSRLYI
jgi:hypothetical protein